MSRLVGVVLAVVFVVAAITKFRDRQGTQHSLSTMGLPIPRVLAVTIPIIEILTALLLVTDPRTGGPCAVALLVAFSTLIVGRLLAGQRQGCGCFGTWSTGDLSWRDLARNALLVVGAVIATLN